MREDRRQELLTKYLRARLRYPYPELVEVLDELMETLKDTERRLLATARKSAGRRRAILGMRTCIDRMRLEQACRGSSRVGEGTDH